jgi:hypothetical protein
MEKGFSLIEMVRISGMGRNTILQHTELVDIYHEDLKAKHKKSDESKE